MEHIQIETTQNVMLEYIPASIGERILAYLIDGLILGAWIIAVIMLMAAIRPAGGDIFYAVIGLLVAFPVMFYDLVSEVFLNGQSVGKRAMKIRVVTLDGTQPTLGAYLMRWIFRLVDISLFSGVVAFITVIVNGKGQRLGDIAAGTSVVKLKPPVDLGQIIPVRMDTTYQVVFPEVSVLTDQNVLIIRQVLQKKDAHLIAQAAFRVKETMGVSSSLNDQVFLETVIKDYTYSAASEE